MNAIKYTTAFLLGIMLFSCHEKEQEVLKDEPVCISDSMAKIIRIDTALMAPVSSELKLSGEISFDDKKVSKIYPFSSGQVLQVNVSAGDKVSKGQTLAVIKSADVSGNYSDLSTAGTDVSIAKKQMDNQESLFKNGIASERELTEAKENYQRALTVQSKLKNQIVINGGGHTSSNGTYIITAPISGYIVEKKINPGSFIRSDANDNLFTIGDISDVWVFANVYETDIAKVKAGNKAAVTTLAYGDSTFNGIVDDVSNIIDPVTKVLRIRVRLANPQGLLKPEMFANIKISNDNGGKALAVSAKSVLSQNGKNYVIIYKGRCDLEVREIQVLKTATDKVYISSGLTEGDKVIMDNQLLLFKALTEK